MPVDKELSRKGAPVFGLPPSAYPGVVRSRSEIYVLQTPEAPKRNPFLKKYENPQDPNRINRGFYPLLYKPGGLLYGR